MAIYFSYVLKLAVGRDLMKFIDHSFLNTFLCPFSFALVLDMRFLFQNHSSASKVPNARLEPVGLHVRLGFELPQASSLELSLTGGWL